MEARKDASTTIQLITAVILTIAGIGLLIAGFLVEPLGEINSSILIAFGEILTFVGAIFGIDYTYKCKQMKSKRKKAPTK